jgi:hypothetical protein
MTANTITISSARRRAIAILVAVGSLAIPTTASATSSAGYSAPNAIIGDSSDRSEPAGRSDYPSLNAIAAESRTSSAVGSSGSSHEVTPGYASLDAITGPSSSEPAVASGSPPSTAHGFDWPSAVVGAGTVLALLALSGAVVLTVRRQRPTASSGQAA